jgi:FkbM family methyltransferase
MAVVAEYDWKSEQRMQNARNRRICGHPAPARSLLGSRREVGSDPSPSTRGRQASTSLMIGYNARSKRQIKSLSGPDYMHLRQLTNFEFRKRLPGEFGGERMYVTARSDARVLKPGWNGCAYDLQLVARHIVKPGMCVWDVGANLGIMSVLAAYRVGSSGAVYALEADPAYADRIFRSCHRLSSAYQPVNVLCAAIANREGILEFAIAKQGHARNKLLGLADEDFEVEARKMVPTIRGDELLEVWRAPDFIKMDVEGAELEALQGSHKILESARPIFYIEVSPENQQSVSELFHDHDYDIFHLQGDGTERSVEECTFYSVARPRAARG